ncbi:iron ABC transporter permease [Roseiarcaceae bacterium H3SJ34-1]|uniref:ABC transporter permease n=1 Tax=Terripilifer ovatus TaxID=3032367 RepID=UPI003AB93559|nr:iron ABC transporter permease [Roseiarcaceae bacterium H3SJ34-1]
MSVLWSSLLLLVVAFLVLSPLFMLLMNSFETNRLGQAVQIGTDNWWRVFTGARLGEALVNTLSLSFARQSLGMAIGVGIAWLIARTNLPYRNLLEIGFWVALFMPALPVTLSWVLLAAGRSGLLNQLVMQLPFVDKPVFEVYSWWGIVWVHLMTSSIAIKVFLLAPAFRSLDSSLEEAARASGASLFGTLTRIVIPILAPVLLVVFLISMVRSMQAFEVELILGAPKQISVYSTVIFGAMTREPPAQGLASALSIVFIVSIIPLVIAQQWFVGRHSYASISGKFHNRTLDLGKWRWPAFAAISGLLALMTIVPFVLLVISTFMNMFGVFGMDNPWTLDNWDRALFGGEISQALSNTLQLSIGAALVGMVVFSVIAYITAKRDFAGRHVLDFSTWLPTLIPGLVLSLGLLQVFTFFPFLRPLYGSMAVLIIAVLMGTMTIGTQIVKSAIGQVGRELEEAAWVSGGSKFYTFSRIILPLIAPSVAVVGLEIFATANAAVGLIVMLGTGATQPLSVLQLTLLDSGRFEQASVIGVIITTLTVSAAILARTIGQRAGLGRQAATT